MKSTSSIVNKEKVRMLQRSVISLKNRLKEGHVNTLRTGDAELRFYITTVQDG